MKLRLIFSDFLFVIYVLFRQINSLNLNQKLMHLI